MNKKYVYFLLIPFVLAGCTNKDKSNHNNNSNKDDVGFIKEDVSITFLCMADARYLDKLKGIIKSFESIEPHVKVNLANPLGTGDYAMLENSVVAGYFQGNHPDMVQCYPDNVTKYIARGFALELNKYLDNPEYGIKENGENDYIEAFLDEGANYTVKGTYSLPFCKSTELMYYNADVLLGLELPGINEDHPLDEEYLDSLTWEELFNNLCPALKTYNDALSDEEKILKPSADSAFFAYDSDENFFITLANQYGCPYTSIDEEGHGSIDYDNDKMKAEVKKMKVAKDAGYLQTKGTYHTYVSSLFTSQQALFTVSSTASLSYNYNGDNPFTIGVAHIPHPAGKEYSSINQGPSVCILDHQDENRALASYLLWKHMTNKENSLDWSLSTGYMGIRKSTYESQAYKDALVVEDKTNLYALAQAENLNKIAEVSSSTFNTSVFKGSGNARSNVGLLLRDCLLSDDLDAEIDELFKNSADEAKTHL